MQLVLISGLSGSGKSVALKVLEDAGYYCVDNLPAPLLASTLAYLKDHGYEAVAVSVDARSGEGIDRVPRRLADLRGFGVDARLLFLEANTDTLVKRFSETRRRHPLSEGDLTLPEAIERERTLLDEVANAAHRIDTSDLSASTLRQWVKDFIGSDRSRLTLLFQSFGFKHGIPLDADLVFDLRCLPNPYYDLRLRPFTGKDTEVIAFLEADANVGRMLGDIRQFLESWLPCFLRDNRSYLTVALGCTGGQHRSVYMVEQLARHFREQVQVLIRHREIS
ncbi:MAG: RNase adapter RapZ [Pseudomonadota bacterium]